MVKIPEIDVLEEEVSIYDLVSWDMPGRGSSRFLLLSLKHPLYGTSKYTPTF